MIAESDNLSRLPTSWAWTTLGEIRSEHRKIISPNNWPDQVFELYSVPSFESRIPEVISGKEIGSSKQVVDVDTVLLCKINPRINRVWIVGGWEDARKIASTEWIPFAKFDSILPKYLCYFMKNNRFRDFLASNVSGVGGSLMRVNENTFAKYPFPVCAFNEQKRIVAKIEELFTRLDAGVEALKKVKAELKRYRYAVLKYAFEGKLTADWRKKNKDKLEPASKLLERIAKEREKNAKGKTKKIPPLDTSELPELPEGWEWAASASLFKWANGKGLPTKKIIDGSYPVYGGNGITGHHNQYLCEDESIIIGRVGANCGNVHLAPPKSWVTDNAIYSVWKSEHLVSKFFLNLLSSMKLNGLSGGSGQPYVSQLILNPLPLRVPSIQEQQQIVFEIDRHFSIADEVEQTIEKSLKESDRLRQSILKKAFEGKLVPQNPNDEPAEKLLARIRAEKVRKRADMKATNRRF